MIRIQSQLRCFWRPAVDCARAVSLVVGKRKGCRVFLLSWLMLVSAFHAGLGADVDAGFLFSRYQLTLEAGERTEALGPLFYEQETGSENTLAFPPIFSHVVRPDTDSEEYDFFYPLLSFDRYGHEYRWHLGQLLNFTGGQDQDEVPRHQFNIFPVYMQQRSPDTNLNYTALFPIYGHLKKRIFRSEIDFVLWPLYVKTVRRPSASPLPLDPDANLRRQFFDARRGDFTTYNYVYPFFHLRYGDGMKGWQLWPLLGREHKEITTKTNVWGDLETTPGYDKRFVLWPFYFDQHREIGTTNAEDQLVVLPFFNRLRSPMRDSTSYLTPIGVTITDDRTRKYHEVGAPWPFIVFTRGEGKTANRVWPFFSRVHTDSPESRLDSNFYLWPLYKFKGIHSPPLDYGRTRILLFLASHTIAKSSETGNLRTRTEVWPFFTHQRDYSGNVRLQVFAPLEPILPASKSIERNYSPLWSVWQAERNPQTGVASQSLFWNLYRRDTSPTVKKSSLLFGLIQYESSAEAKRWRLFYLPQRKSQSPPDHVPEHR
jgi:hypothetical protein